MDRDQLGRLRVNGKVISEAAIEQRLRRFTAVKKNGKVKSGSDIKERFDDLDRRQELIDMYKECNLDKAWDLKLINQALPERAQPQSPQQGHQGAE